MSKRLLIIDCSSNCLDLAMRAQMAGWDVKWWDKPRKDGSVRRAGEGIIDKITEFSTIQRKWLDWADLIYSGADNAHYTEFLDPYFAKGYPIFGPTTEAAELELDRAAGQKAMKSCGIPIMDAVVFNDYDAAIAFVKKNGDKVFVSKPSGDADKAMSYVSNSAADMVYMLTRWKTNEKASRDARKHGFILQEKKVGSELAVGGWYGPGGWSKWFVENAEYKKLMDGDLGVNTGEQGTLVRVVRQSKLAEKVLLPLGPVLKKMNYVGYIDNACIIEDDGTPWPMELTMRDGWPLKHNLMSLEDGDPCDWMLDLLTGSDTLQMKEDVVSISVVVTIPDFPYSHITNKELCGYPIYHATDMEHVHLSEAMLQTCPVQIEGKVIDMPSYVTAGDYVLVVTGTGDTITGARKSAYAATRKIKIPNSPSYRLDIGKGRMVEQLPKLQKHGYFKGLTF